MEEEVAHGAFLEHAAVHGNMYGTSIRAVAAVCAAGKVPVLDIDVQGAAKVGAAIPARPPSSFRRVRGVGGQTTLMLHLYSSRFKK